MKAIVSGGAGFIGSHLVELLLRGGHTVTVIDNFSTGRPENLAHLKGLPQLSVVQAELGDIELIRPHFKAVDWVFHMAALADVTRGTTPRINQTSVSDYRAGRRGDRSRSGYRR